MKVLHVINSLGTGGAEKLLLDSIPLLNRSGITADVALLDNESYPFRNKLEELNCCEIHILSGRLKSVYNPLFIFKIIPFLYKYDIVHVHLFPAQYFVALAKILSSAKIKLIFTEHSTNNRRMGSPILRVFDKFIYRQYKKIVCISTKVKDVLMDKMKLPEQQLIVIENGINLAMINNAIASKRVDFLYSTDDCILIMVAAFRKEKDHDVVFKVLKELPLNYRLILAGDGERKQELVNLGDELGITKRINFLGVRSDIPELIKMSDIAILSSHWEGFGLAAAEAMAAGIPVIASNVEGLSQVVAGGGVLFKKGNVQELHDQIVNLSTDSVLYKKTSYNGIVKSRQYDIQILIDKSIKLYKEIYNG